jgi:hypothetical protein
MFLINSSMEISPWTFCLFRSNHKLFASIINISIKFVKILQKIVTNKKHSEIYPLTFQLLHTVAINLERQWKIDASNYIVFCKKGSFMLSRTRSAGSRSFDLAHHFICFTGYKGMFIDLVNKSTFEVLELLQIKKWILSRIMKK